MLTIYHNPRCSKSRAALALLAQCGCDYTVRRYLDKPLDDPEIRALLAILTTPPETLLRDNEPEYAAFGLPRQTAPDVDTVVRALLAHPRLMQRPVVSDGNHAVIARPPEAIQSLLP